MDNPQFFLFGMATGLALSAAVQFVVYQVAGYRNVPVLTADAVGLVSAVPATQKLMDKLTSQLSVSSKSLQNIVLHMVAEFKKGLAQDGQVMKMIPSYVRHLPTGNETGSVLALDMGGSNFRVLHAKLEGAGRIKTIQRKWALTEAYKHIAGPKLFDFFAECVSSFIKEERLGDGPHKLGFTFSFPVHQTAINRGSLMEWAKGFDNEGVEGQDVVLLLEAAFKRRKLDISVTALVNDTVGTLVTHCYQDPKTYIAVILGTGTNAAYVEKACNVTKWTESEGDVVINTEWGAYGEPSILPITQYDHELDRASANPKKHMFEKMISGLYMGELTRVIMMDLVASGNLFKGIGSTQLGTRHLFDTAYMSRIERDHSSSLMDTKNVLEDVMGIPKSTLEDRRIVKHLCELVGTRAARLSAAGIAALVTKINRLDQCTVAIDGSVYQHYPHFGNRIRDALRELLGITAENITLEQARDGSGQGAALIALLHS